MPTRGNPTTAGNHDQGMVEAERLNCGATGRGQPDNPRAILTPPEMRVPVLLTRMKEWDRLTTLRVYRVCPGLLVAIARRACKAKVLGSGGSRVRAGNDVVNLVFQADDLF